MSDERTALKDRIKEANDIVEVVGSYISLRPAGPTFKGLCPWHDDHRPSFDVDPRRQRYKCWVCNKFGDVINFIQDFERVSFLEALELLARRAGIVLEKTKNSSTGPSRASMLDVVRWAAEQFQACLRNSPLAESARHYLAERRLTDDTIHRFGLGFAPPSGDWFVQKAAQAGISFELLETVGLIAPSNDNNGHYSRFRDRVMFPIRDLRGQPVGFGGRILPSSPLSAKAPKYYNSAETPLFAKSDQLYGIDQARQAATKAGYLAVVEGYTDVLMAHQHGVHQVVATMGTALNARHVHKLRGLVPRVVLVFDADQGGDTGVDRALEVFVSQEMDLRVAALPEGLDPCDLLAAQGSEPFVRALENAQEVFEFKLQRVWEKEASQGLEGERRAVDQMLTIIARSPLASSPEKSPVKIQRMVNRIGHRLQVSELQLWKRLSELRAAQKSPERKASHVPAAENPSDEERTAKAARYEIELLEVLLAEPAHLARVQQELTAEEIEHPGLRQLLEGLLGLANDGLPVDLDQLRGRLDNDRLMAKALELQDGGLGFADRAASLEGVLARFREKRLGRRQRELKHQAVAAGDHESAVAVLKQLQNHGPGEQET